MNYRQTILHACPVALLVLFGAGLAMAERLKRVPGYQCDEVKYKNGAWEKGYSRWQDSPASGGTYLRYGESWQGNDGKEFRGYYLNFNHRREAPEVFLSPDPGPGSLWKIEEMPRVQEPGGFGYTIPTRISPAAGPMKNWILSTEDGKLVLKKNGTPAKIFASIDDLEDGK
jgi:hypothetical protein